MLRIVTSLSFLYAVSIFLLLAYGFYYYRDFSKPARQRRAFPVIFILIFASCFFFLWVNIHAPLRLRTYSNLDHHFIRHDGFVVNGNLRLGAGDTANYSNGTYNNFDLSRKGANVTVHSPYSEEPFYIGQEGQYHVVSRTFPAVGHSFSFIFDGVPVTVKANDEGSFSLTVKDETYVVQKPLRKGIALWNLFRDESSFIRSDHYNDPRLVASLRHLYLLRDNVSRRSGGELRFFASGRLAGTSRKMAYDGRSLSVADLSFQASIPDRAFFAWGIGFLDNNRNQFRLHLGNSDSFTVLYRYPVSYPLTEEKIPGRKEDWSSHSITRFLVADSRDILRLPAVFRAGFLYPAFSGDSTSLFDPLVLTYQKSGGDEPLQLRVAGPLKTGPVTASDERLLLPARSQQFNWLFTVRNTFNWEFSGSTLTPATWQALMFGSLLLFFAFVLLTAVVVAPARLSWVWQLLACLAIVMLTTRFFLYWRYKTFPPYEGMDLPSQQQLLSYWNFGIILLTTIALALIFGFAGLRRAWQLAGQKIASVVKVPYRPGTGRHFNFTGEAATYFSGLAVTKRFGARFVFFAAWLLVLAGGGVLAFVFHFDPGVCRHLAIGLTLLYFIFLYISYRHSPLVVATKDSWWRINTSRTTDIIINNPVKVLLSISLMAAFVFIDIGFAIVFLNFLLFNEAFLCINYAVAGLSAGSRRNAVLFGAAGAGYMVVFVANLLYAPYIFQAILNLPQSLYMTGYILFAILLAYHWLRVLPDLQRRKRWLTGIAVAAGLYLIAFFFFPKQKILDKAAMTRYRIEVLTMPVEQAIESAYSEGKTYEPVIRAAQNQWFINTFIYEKNNPDVQSPGFQLLPHAPQNKGAKYNAQATDLVASRFFLAEHGKWSVLLYVLLLLVPTVLLASFYKLYPDFTNRINDQYPTITAGFSILNYLLITALLVILAATGRYIFFGQDMPFGSILSKQSILFPSILIVATVLLFRNISLEYYANRRKLVPGAMIFAVLTVLLFFVRPSFNRNREFNTGELAASMDNLIQVQLQPVLDYYDTAAATRRYSIARKDRLFTDSLKKLIAADALEGQSNFFTREINNYASLDITRHVDQSRMIYLDLYSGRPQLTFNDNYFRVEPPPHLQQAWTGNVYGDSTIYNITFADLSTSSVLHERVDGEGPVKSLSLDEDIALAWQMGNAGLQLALTNAGNAELLVRAADTDTKLEPGASLTLSNPWKASVTDQKGAKPRQLMIEPDAYMKNYYVNGSRYYVYPLGSRFVWARNFAESIASSYTEAGKTTSDAVVSLDFELMDSLTARIESMMGHSDEYGKGAEYGICIADGNGRLLAMTDFVKGLERPDPNDKAGFNKVVLGDNGFVSQSLLRKQIGNINLLRLNPGPGSTLKPIVFTAIASQLALDWSAFSSQGFSEPQQYFGGQKVAEYDFETNNGNITNVIDYLKYSDNYYHSNVLLLGSYPRQSPEGLLSRNFVRQNPGPGMHWPYFTYHNAEFWLDGFRNWPGYENGRANFGSDSSFTSIGLFSNYGIYTHTAKKSFDMFATKYDSLLFSGGAAHSGFILPEYPLFDQQGINVNHSIPYDLFVTCFRGHVKGSSQVLIPPVKMTETFGRLVSQNRNYTLTLNPYAEAPVPSAFSVDPSIQYNSYLSLVREGVFEGLKQVLRTGTAARLGALLPKDAGYFYYGKTGTTGDNSAKTKSKLLALVISEKDIADPGFSFRSNRFYTLYFTLQNGPATQNEEFQAAIVRCFQNSRAFKRYMKK